MILRPKEINAAPILWLILVIFIVSMSIIAFLAIKSYRKKFTKKPDKKESGSWYKKITSKIPTGILLVPLILLGMLGIIYLVWRIFISNVQRKIGAIEIPWNTIFLLSIGAILLFFIGKWAIKKKPWNTKHSKNYSWLIGIPLTLIVISMAISQYVRHGKTSPGDFVVGLVKRAVPEQKQVFTNQPIPGRKILERSFNKGDTLLHERFPGITYWYVVSRGDTLRAININDTVQYYFTVIGDTFEGPKVRGREFPIVAGIYRLTAETDLELRIHVTE